MTNSICDDKLITMVGNELSRIGLFTPVSEVEQSAISIYGKLRGAYIASNKKNFVLDSTIKNDTYYSFLSNAVIVDIFSRSRLKNIRTPFELNSALCLLDGYLHNLSSVSNTAPFKARDIFEDTIIALPPDAQVAMFIPNPPNTQSDHHLDAMRYATEYPCQFQGNTKCSDYYEVPKLCNNCEGDECFDTINMTIEYGGICFGFRVDPELLGFNQPLEQCDVQVFKNFIKKGAKQFILEADKVFMQLYRQHEELMDDD